jgi:hypothetical protein
MARDLPELLATGLQPLSSIWWETAASGNEQSALAETRG